MTNGQVSCEIAAQPARVRRNGKKAWPNLINWADLISALQTKQASPMLTCSREKAYTYSPICPQRVRARTGTAARSLAFAPHHRGSTGSKRLARTDCGSRPDQDQ